MTAPQTYAYACESPDGILISISADPMRSFRILREMTGSAKLLGYIPSSYVEYHELMTLVGPYRNESGFLRSEGHVLGFLAALPVHYEPLRLVYSENAA